MAFLMLLHEKMRLTRKKNALTYKALKTTRKYDRITKNIENIQKLYGKKETQLESMKKIWTTQMTSAINQQFGIWGGNTMGSFNPYNMMGMNNGMTSDMNSIFTQMAGASNPSLNGLQQGDFSQMMQLYQTGGYSAVQNATNQDGSKKWTDALLQGFSAVASAAQQWTAMKQTSAQNAIQQMTMNMEYAIEEMKNQMEEEQEEALLPLKEEQTELDLEKASQQTEQEEIKAALQSIDQELKEEAQNAAPKFGL